MDIEMLPKGDGCQCADCRAGRGDTQFAEFMERVDARSTPKNRLKSGRIAYADQAGKPGKPSSASHR